MLRKKRFIRCVVLLLVFQFLGIANAHDFLVDPDYPFKKVPKQPTSTNCSGPDAQEILSTTCDRYNRDNEYMVAYYWVFKNQELKPYTIILQDGQCSLTDEYVAPVGTPLIVNFAWWEEAYRQIQLECLTPITAYISGVMLVDDPGAARTFKAKFSNVQH